MLLTGAYYCMSYTDAAVMHVALVVDRQVCDLEEVACFEMCSELDS